MLSPGAGESADENVQATNFVAAAPLEVVGKPKPAAKVVAPRRGSTVNASARKPLVAVKREKMAASLKGVNKGATPQPSKFVKVKSEKMRSSLRKKHKTG